MNLTVISVESEGTVINGFDRKFVESVRVSAERNGPRVEYTSGVQTAPRVGDRVELTIIQREVKK